MMLADERIRLLTLVDIFERERLEEIENINWKHLNTSVDVPPLGVRNGNTRKAVEDSSACS